MENLQQLRLLQKEEAIKRLKLLNVDKGVIKAFKEKDLVYYSERQNSFFDGIIYYLKNNPEWIEMVKNFEEENDCLVYHAQLTHTTFGDLLSLLYVNSETETWEADDIELATGYRKRGYAYVFAYVVNLNDETMSDFGDIAVAPKNGGITRMY